MYFSHGNKVDVHLCFSFCDPNPCNRP